MEEESTQNLTALPHSFYERADTEDYNKFMQTMEKPIEKLILKLRGREIVYDKESQSYKEVSRSTPMMNENGVNYVQGLLESVLMPNTYMAKLEEGQSRRYIIGTKKQIGKIVNTNRINWQIELRNIRPTISLISMLIAMALIKAKSDKDFLSETISARYANMSRDGQRQQQDGQNFGF